MTAHSILRSGKRSGRGNRKDGQGRRPKPKFDDSSYENAGFVRCDWNKWQYTIKFIIDCPGFVLVPHTVFNEGLPEHGQLARRVEKMPEFGKSLQYADGEGYYIPPNTDPQLISQRLDAAILSILNADHQVYVYDGADKVVLKVPVDQREAVYWVNRLEELRSYGHDVGTLPGIEPV